jgi:hypothetical protein
MFLEVDAVEGRVVVLVLDGVGGRAQHLTRVRALHRRELWRRLLGSEQDTGADCHARGDPCGNPSDRPVEKTHLCR